MLQAFKAFNSKEKLFAPGDKILLAISGGMDSVAMAELFFRAGYIFAISHCNFQLRGEESEKDEAFVSLLARKYKVPFYCQRFLTMDVTESKGISVQMAARELRYDWFSEILKKEKYLYLATAHHLDDQIETFFINMLRSTGIAGFHGIIPRQGNIIRPMLFAYRSEIEDFVRKNKLPYREDHSNQEVKYLRNMIRHELLPVMAGINPGFKNILTENICRVREAEKIFRETVEAARKRAIREEKTRTCVSIRETKKLSPSATYLFEFLIPYGFNYPVVNEIVKALDEDPGKQFFSSTHRLIKDREDLIITPLTAVRKKRSQKNEFSISRGNARIKVPLKLTFKKTTRDQGFLIDTSSQVANLDFQKVSFPLNLRKWKPGDTFYPFGRSHKKKLSDFFTDNKFSIDEKENTWLLCSEGKIIWVVGHRIDNRFRITSRTRDVLQIRLHK